MKFFERFSSERPCCGVKDLFYHWQNVSNSTLYPDVLKIKTNCCETKFYKNAICLLFTNFQIHHLATLLPGCPSHRVARYGFINKKMAFLKNFVWQQSLFLFSKHLDTMSNLTHLVNSKTDPWTRAYVRGGQIWISRHWNRVLPRVTIAIWLFNIQICLKKVKIPNICQKRSKLETLGGNNRKTSVIADNSCCIQNNKNNNIRWDQF